MTEPVATPSEPSQPIQHSRYPYPPQYGSYTAPLQVALVPSFSPHKRPGAVTAATVLAYIEAGLVFISGLVLFLIAVAGKDTGEEGKRVEFNIDGAVNMVLTTGLIFGAILLAMGRDRIVLGIATLATLGNAVYWLIRYGWDILAGVLVYVPMPAIAFGLLFVSGVSRWLQTKKAQRSEQSTP